MLLALIILIFLAVILCFFPNIQKYLETFGNSTEVKTTIKEIKPFISTPGGYNDILCDTLDNLGNSDLDIQDMTTVPSQNIPSDELDRVVSHILDTLRSATKGKGNNIGIGNMVLMDVTGTVNRSETFAYYELKGMLHNATRRVTNKILVEIYDTDTGFKIKRISTICNDPMTPVFSSDKGSYQALPMDLAGNIPENKISLDIGYPNDLEPMINEIEEAMEDSAVVDDSLQGTESGMWLDTKSLTTQSLSENYENPSSVVRRFKEKKS